MKLSDLCLPTDRQEYIKSMCIEFNVGGLYIADSDFASEWWKNK